MSDRLLKESDVIEAFKGREPLIHDVYTATAIIRSVPSADDDFCSYGERITNAKVEDKPTPIRDYMVYGERSSE